MAAQCVTRGKNGRNITSQFVVSIERRRITVRGGAVRFYSMYISSVISVASSPSFAALSAGLMRMLICIHATKSELRETRI